MSTANLIFARLGRILFGMMAAMTLITTVQTAHAQGFGRFAPLEFVARGVHQPGEDLSTATLGIVRAVPIYTLLPQTTPDSRFDALRLEAGARFAGGDTEFRWRATAVDFEIQKSPWAAAFKLLDVNRAGIRKERTEWIGLSIGPGFFVDRMDWAVSARLMGHLSATTYAFGNASYPELPAVKDRRTGGAYGGRGRLSIRAGHSVMIDVSGLVESNTSGDSPLEIRGDASIKWAFSPRFDLRAFGGLSTVEFGGATSTTNWFGVGLRFRRMADSF